VNDLSANVTVAVRPVVRHAIGSSDSAASTASTDSDVDITDPASVMPSGIHAAAHVSVNTDPVTVFVGSDVPSGAQYRNPGSLRRSGSPSCQEPSDQPFSCHGAAACFFASVLVATRSTSPSAR
jgi:hypothetical protein